jgi:hypothetical protein
MAVWAFLYPYFYYSWFGEIVGQLRQGGATGYLGLDSPVKPTSGLCEALDRVERSRSRQKNRELPIRKGASKEVSQVLEKPFASLDASPPPGQIPARRVVK